MGGAAREVSSAGGAAAGPGGRPDVRRADSDDAEVGADQNSGGRVAGGSRVASGEERKAHRRPPCWSSIPAHPQISFLALAFDPAETAQTEVVRRTIPRGLEPGQPAAAPSRDSTWRWTGCRSVHQA